VRRFTTFFFTKTATSVRYASKLMDAFFFLSLKQVVSAIPSAGVSVINRLLIVTPHR
jgi:hypothetical protein